MGFRVVVVAERLKVELLFFSVSACSRRIGAEIFHAVCSGLWNLGEDASDKLEDVEGLSFGMGEEGVVGCVLFRLVEKRFCAGSPMNA